MRNVIATVTSWLAIGAVMLVACGPGAPKAGTVVDTRFEEERRWTTTRVVEHCLSRDENFNCVSRWYETVIDNHYDDPDWMVKLEECKYDDSGNRKCRAGWREIDRQDWEALKVGDFYGERQE